MFVLKLSGLKHVFNIWPQSHKKIPSTKLDLRGGDMNFYNFTFSHNEWSKINSYLPTVIIVRAPSIK